jgi:molecular chaperone DnaJ
VRDLYEILGVGHDAGEDEIKRAYRRKARELHPDTGGDPEAFKELTAAYEVLKNPQARANYDRYGDPRGPGGVGGDPFAGFGDLSDLINAFFGGGFETGGFETRGRSNPRASGRDAIVDVVLKLDEAAAGIRRDVEIHLSRPCATCGGAGTAPGTRPSTCATCGGRGAVQQVARSIFGQMLTTGTCPDCRGTGERITHPCDDCRGEGRREITEVVSVDVPPGVDDGTRLRVSGRGEAGRRGGRAGDLYVRVRVTPHDIFERDGVDLHCELRLPMTQAALGAELKVPTLHGEEVVKLKPGTQSGDIITLRRQGMPKLGAETARGDLLIHCRVETPTGLDTAQADLLRSLAGLRGEDASGPGEQRGFLSKLREVLGGRP